MVRTQLFISSIVLSLILTGCTPSSQNFVTTDKTQNIVGGTEMGSADDLALSLIAVYDSVEGQLCTGTLINRNVVLTAAHCVGPEANKMYIFFGSKIENESIYVQVDKFEVSPYWNANAGKDLGDLALLHFSGTLPAPYKPALMLPPAATEVLKKDVEIVVAGYGVAEGTKLDGAKILRKAQVRISDESFSKSEVLVDQTAGHGVCHGDSGGPAFVAVDGQYYLWGVTSRGIDDSENSCMKSAAFTRISYYQTWINRMALKLSSSLLNFLWRGQ